MKILKCSGGFTFIEVMIAILIITLTALGLMYGTVHAHGELRALEFKERATEELTSYLEYWKGRVADGHISAHDENGDYLGKKVYLIGDENSGIQVPAKLYYDIDAVESKYNNDAYKAYHIKVWIIWKDFIGTTGGAISNEFIGERKRILETVMIDYGL